MLDRYLKKIALSWTNNDDPIGAEIFISIYNWTHRLHRFCFVFLFVCFFLGNQGSTSGATSSSWTRQTQTQYKVQSGLLKDLKPEALKAKSPEFLNKPTYFTPSTTYQGENCDFDALDASGSRENMPTLASQYPQLIYPRSYDSVFLPQHPHHIFPQSHVYPKTLHIFNHCYSFHAYPSPSPTN